MNAVVIVLLLLLLVLLVVGYCLCHRQKRAEGTPHVFAVNESAGSVPPPPPPNDSGALPDGWTEVLDQASGRMYYVHRATHETTWSRPGVPRDAV